jgi:drug/metabolite transporter (DMT)-like permease
MGEIAAVVTSVCWSLNSIQFTLAGRRVGSEVVNRVRLVLAVLYLSLAHLLLYGELWPVHAGPFRWGWLGLSGVIGLVIGDACLFQAFLFIGPRRAMLLMTLVPVISTLLAWGWLGETLRPAEVGAVLLTVGGIAWVVAERRRDPAGRIPAQRERHYMLGVLLGLGGAMGQALGLVTAKQGLNGDFPSLSATVIRMVVGSGVIWLLTLFRGQVGATWRALGDRRARLFIVGGSLIGPFIGVWLSMVAVQHAQVGIASTLMALSPIIMIPLDHWIFHESVSLRSVAGTVVALVGAAIIFLT